MLPAPSRSPLSLISRRSMGTPLNILRVCIGWLLVFLVSLARPGVRPDKHQRVCHTGTSDYCDMHWEGMPVSVMAFRVVDDPQGYFPAEYNLGLVALSIAIAVCASYAALESGWPDDCFMRPQPHTVAHWWSVRHGSGIWAMHYIGMLAYDLPVTVSYDVPLLMLTWRRLHTSP